MTEEVDDLQSEIGDITKALKDLPTKDKLQALQKIVATTRQQIEKISTTTNKLHDTTSGIAALSKTDKSREFAKRISE
jgi:hypothetical protein